MPTQGLIFSCKFPAFSQRTKVSQNWLLAIADKLNKFVTMSSAPKYTPHYTYEDYLLWEGKWELIEGIPYAMSPAPSIKHQRITSELNFLFVQALKKCHDCKVYEPIDWKIGNDTVLQPDMLVVCKPFTNNNYLDFPPTLVAEIISPSSSKSDRREKYEIYEAHAVKYYLIIDPSFKKLEVFELINSVYQAVAVNPTVFEFSLDDDCTAAIDFTSLFDE
jgi:Uma2 family endonuclease